jgi:transcriptional regulator with XRE-family HTH domain
MLGVARQAGAPNKDGKTIDGNGQPNLSEIDAHVGGRIRLRRQVLGLTLSELGARCSLSAQQVHKYEQGLNSMSAGRLVQFGDALSVSVGWFFNESEIDGGLPSEVLNILADPQNTKVISLLLQVNDPEIKKLIINLVKNVVEYNNKEPKKLLRTAIKTADIK